MHVHMHAQIPDPLKCSASSEEPEAVVQLKPFVMCHTVLLQLGQLYAL